MHSCVSSCVCIVAIRDGLILSTLDTVSLVQRAPILGSGPSEGHKINGRGHDVMTEEEILPHKFILNYQK